MAEVKYKTAEGWQILDIAPAAQEIDLATTEKEGLIPALSGNENEFFNGQGEWTEINIFDSTTPGLVPAPIEANIIGVFKGATETEDGTSGLVPPPLNAEV